MTSSLSTRCSPPTDGHPTTHPRGIDEVKAQLTWIKPRETFDFDFSEEEWVDYGEGRLACRVHEVYRLKDSGEFAYERDRRVEVGIRDGKIGRYEMRIVG